MLLIGGVHIMMQTFIIGSPVHMTAPATPHIHTFKKVRNCATSQQIKTNMIKGPTGNRKHTRSILAAPNFPRFTRS